MYSPILLKSVGSCFKIDRATPLHPKNFLTLTFLRIFKHFLLCPLFLRVLRFISRCKNYDLLGNNVYTNLKKSQRAPALFASVVLLVFC